MSDSFPDRDFYIVVEETVVRPPFSSEDFDENGDLVLSHDDVYYKPCNCGGSWFFETSERAVSHARRLFQKMVFHRQNVEIIENGSTIVAADQYMVNDEMTTSPAISLVKIAVYKVSRTGACCVDIDFKE